MRAMYCGWFLFTILTTYGQEAGVVFDFNKPTLAENGWNIIPGGFTNAAPGIVEPVTLFGNPIPSSKDKKGLAITVQPRQVAFLYTTAPIDTNGQPVLLRLTLRADGKDAAVTLAVLRGGLADTDGSIAIHTPASAAAFVEQERDLVLLYEPDTSHTVSPVIQVAATGESGPVMVLLDRLEITRLNAAETYPGSRFQSASTIAGLATPTPHPTEIPISTPTALPPTSTPIIPPTPTAGASVTVAEKEPNNTLAQTQNLNRLEAGSSIQITGQVASGGISNGQYFGDIDFYSFTLPSLAEVTVTLDWDGSADLDAAVLVNGTLFYQTGATKPLTFSAPSPEGTYTLLIASKDQPADYRCTLTAATAQPAYSNDVALLNGRFFQDPTIGILFWYNFDGRGNYEYWLYNESSGSDSIQQRGTYTVSYPFLILHHDGTDETYYFVVLAPNAFTLNGQRYIKE